MAEIIERFVLSVGCILSLHCGASAHEERTPSLHDGDAAAARADASLPDGDGGLNVPDAATAALDAGSPPDPTAQSDDPGHGFAVTGLSDPALTYSAYTPRAGDRVVSRAKYYEQLQGFWLGECIANWSGLITELDKVGTPETLPFYTDEDWGTDDRPSMWGLPGPAAKIAFFFVEQGGVWGADDDTDLEYMYQHLLDTNDVSVLSAEQIRDGWLTHIWQQDVWPWTENYLWVSNQRAYDLMSAENLLPPLTSEPAYNSDFEMIDAQLTTELFGLLSPARPDKALELAHLPIRTTGKYNAEWASEFYVIMHSLASYVNPELPLAEQLAWLAERASERLPERSTVRAMYDFVAAHYASNPDKDDWESTRDALYAKYQLGEGGSDGYAYREPWDAAINFASSLVSLFYGQGDLPRTVRIAALMGWDSDNPTATWGGLLGFMLGKRGVEAAFGKAPGTLSEAYFIHRTRRNFPDHTPDADGEDTFSLMAARGLYIIDRVVLEELGGGVDLANDVWYIPDRSAEF